MKPLALGALLGLLWLTVGLPLGAPVAVLTAVAQPVILAFILGLATRPYLPRLRRWAR